MSKHNFSEKLKAELLNVKFKNAAEKRACLSAYVRSSGTICSEGGAVGFELNPAGEAEKNFFVSIIRSLYNFEPQTITSVRRGKITLKVLGGKSAEILLDLGIIEKDEEGIALKLGIDENQVTDGTRGAYLRGLFLGSGSVTVPNAERTSTIVSRVRPRSCEPDRRTSGTGHRIFSRGRMIRP